jgi:hypothetical protein
MANITMANRFMLLLIALFSFASLSSAFVTPNAYSNVHQRSKISSSSRSLIVVESAKILPFAYTSASAALLIKATKATSKSEMAVLLATSTLSLVNLGPRDNAQLASAKKAFKNTPPASSGKAKQQRQAAKTWRSVVRIKIIGQLAGLLRMSCAKGTKGVMRGAAIIMAANVAFFLCGGGPSKHDDDGNWVPMPSNVSSAVTTIDAILSASALLAASSPVGSMRHAVSAGIFTAGAVMGTFEGLPKFLESMGRLFK